ncbi:hypothetical protein [Guggenheimella bovis]
MKRIGLLLLAALVLFTGCANKGTPSSEPVKSGEPAVAVPKTGEPIQPAQVQEQDNLLSKYYEKTILKSKYHIERVETQTVGDMTTTNRVHAYRDGENVALITSSMDGAAESRFVSKDNFQYLINDKDKTYYKQQNSQVVKQDEIAKQTIQNLRAQQFVKGMGQYKGKDYETLTLTIQANTMTFYFENGDLKFTVAKSETGEQVQEVVAYNENVPASVFEIPADYKEKVIDMPTPPVSSEPQSTEAGR